MEIINNPFDMVIKAAKNLYPDMKADIQFNPTLKCWKLFNLHFGKCGRTTFNKGQAPIVDISTNIPFEAMVEVLAHELAHVAVGPKEKHNSVWENAFDAIHKEYSKLVMEREEQCFAGTDTAQSHEAASGL